MPLRKTKHRRAYRRSGVSKLKAAPYAAAIVGLTAKVRESQNAPSRTALTKANTAKTARTLSFRESSIRPPFADMK
jgi:hypothetical protein